MSPVPRLGTSFLIVAVLLGSLPVPAGAAPAPSLCRGESAAFSVGATVADLLPFIEVQLVVANRSAAGQRFDPMQVTLESRGAQVRALTVQQAKDRVKDISGRMVMVLLGPLGVVAGAASLAGAVREIDQRAMRAQEVAPGAEVRGSVYFPPAEKSAKHVRLTAGDGIRLMCPVITAETATMPPATTTLSLDASVRTGGLNVRVSFVEFTPDGTAIDVVFENQSQGNVDVFWGLASAVLQSGGTSYQVRAARSDFANTVAPATPATARLVFDAMPAPGPSWSGVLVLPGIRMGDRELEVRVELAFPGGAR